MATRSVSRAGKASSRRPTPAEAAERRSRHPARAAPLQSVGIPRNR
jgi:hypothetical protein